MDPTYNEEEQYTVSKILNHRKKNGCWELEISWEGYQTEDNTWEPLETISSDIPKVLKDYCLEQNIETYTKGGQLLIRKISSRRVQQPQRTGSNSPKQPQSSSQKRQIKQKQKGQKDLTSQSSRSPAVKTRGAQQRQKSKADLSKLIPTPTHRREIKNSNELINSQINQIKTAREGQQEFLKQILHDKVDEMTRKLIQQDSDDEQDEVQKKLEDLKTHKKDNLPTKPQNKVVERKESFVKPNVQQKRSMSRSSNSIQKNSKKASVRSSTMRSKSSKSSKINSHKLPRRSVLNESKQLESSNQGQTQLKPNVSSFKVGQIQKQQMMHEILKADEAKQNEQSIARKNAQKQVRSSSSIVIYEKEKENLKDQTTSPTSNGSVKNQPPKPKTIENMTSQRPKVKRVWKEESNINVISNKELNQTVIGGQQYSSRSMKQLVNGQTLPLTLNRKRAAPPMDPKNTLKQSFPQSLEETFEQSEQYLKLNKNTPPPSEKESSIPLKNLFKLPAAKLDQEIQCKMDDSDTDSDHVYEQRAKELNEVDEEFQEFQKYVEQGVPAGCKAIEGKIWMHDPKFIVAEAKRTNEKDEQETLFLIFFDLKPSSLDFPTPQWYSRTIIEARFPHLVISWLQKLVEQQNKAITMQSDPLERELQRQRRRKMRQMITNTSDGGNKRQRLDDENMLSD